MEQIAFSILLVLLGLFVGVILVILINYLKGNLAAKKVEALLERAKKDADKVKRDYLLEAKEEAHRLKKETEKEIKEKKNEMKESEDRLLARENNMDRRDQTLQNREQMLEDKENHLIQKQKDIQDEQAKVEEIKKEQIQLLESIAGFSKNQARELVLKKVEDMMSLEIAALIKDREAEAKLEVDKKSKDTIEAVTGVDLIIDDTPEAIVLSSFDPLRREIARVTLETLIKDGRIHPTRIEEVYDKVSKDMNAKILEYGNNALFELGITKMDPELVELVGKLHFRTSYGQNALQHSIEVASLSGLLAAELGENVNLAKRAGLLHDIGKAIDHEVEGSHVELGADLARKFHENDTVLNAIESHHGDHPATTIISEIVAIADTLSASRPGARNDSLENYVKRLQELEAIANDMDGIEKTFAVQAGRELRVIVKPEEIDDLGSYKVARDIKNKIEEQMQYPGTIKVTVIRETRATEEAK